jgi:hypothetical protein
MDLIRLTKYSRIIPKMIKKNAIHIHTYIYIVARMINRHWNTSRGYRDLTLRYAKHTHFPRYRGNRFRRTQSPELHKPTRNKLFLSMLTKQVSDNSWLSCKTHSELRMTKFKFELQSHYVPQSTNPSKGRSLVHKVNCTTNSLARTDTSCKTKAPTNTFLVSHKV